MTLRISLLGPTQINRDGESLSIPGYRPLALLTYLLISGKPRSREHLVHMLFDRPDDPRAALRWTLSQLRKSIGSEAITADRKTIAFNFESDYWLDIAAFEAGELDLYRGELLEGLFLRDAHQYEGWLLGQRERLRARYQAGLEERLLEQQRAEDAAAVEKTVRQLLLQDNMREDWHRALMSVYAQQGKFEAAQAQYELCRKILHVELNTTPAPETIALAQAIEQQQADLVRVVAARTPVSYGAPDVSKTGDPLNQRISPASGGTGSQAASSWPLTRKIILTLSGLGLLLIVIVLSLVSFQGARRSAAAGDEPQAAAPLAKFPGTTVTIMGPFDDETREVWETSFASFEEETGIDIQIAAYPVDFEQVVSSVVDSGVGPDIANFPQPGLLAGFVRQGKIVDVRTFLDEPYLQQQYGESLLEAAMMEDQMAGVWIGNNVKSLVWYPKRAFDEAGYEEPQTWDELNSLSRQITANGGTPWCIGMESGEASTGWVATDWVEDILLRTAPKETYDAWVNGELPFDSPEIRRVLAIMEDIWFDEAAVYGGRESILSERWFESPAHLFTDPPGCFLHRQGSFIVPFFPEEAIYGQDYDFFYLPPIDPQYGKPILGGGDMMAMFNDRPEVREVMHYFTTAESVREFVQKGSLIAPHRDAPFEWYTDPARLKIAQILFDADTYRFDGSDRMPAEVGTGSFWQGMVAWAEGEDLGAVLQAIDESWPAK